MIEVKFEGIEELSTALSRWEEDVIQVIEGEVAKSGEHLIGTAQRLAPKLVGDLEGSGTVDPVVRDIVKREIRIEVGFRGLPYAIRMHESVYNLGPISRGKPSVDGMMVGRKYLEQPLLKYSQRYFREWAEAISNTGLR